MKIKRLLSIMTALAVILSVWIIPSDAAESKVSVTRIWSGLYDIKWYNGKKSSYDISTPEELNGLAYIVLNKDPLVGVTINLTNDIVLNDTSDWDKWGVNYAPKNKWIPIGDTGNPIKGYKPFAGVFNGNGHTISGMYVNTDRPAGLFGYIYKAAVKNVKIDKSVVICNNPNNDEFTYAGSIAGIADMAFIDKCENYGAVKSISPPADAMFGDLPAYAGGIVGAVKMENTVKLFFNTALAAGGVFVNPLIITDGEPPLSASYIRDCKNEGNIYAKAAGHSGSYAGGIVGFGDLGWIENSFNIGTVNAYRERLSIGDPITLRSNGGNIMGGTNRCEPINCYFWNGESTVGIGEMMNRSLKYKTTGKTREEIISKSFVKKLGSSFKYVKGDAPHVSAIKKYPIYVVLNGEKANISWKKAANAVSYSIYKKNSDGKLTKVKTVKSTEASVPKIKQKKKYSIVIKANYKNGSSKTIPSGSFTFKAPAIRSAASN